MKGSSHKMELTVEEYQRGTLFWDMDANSTFWTSTSQTMEAQEELSGPLTAPKGSKVESPPYQFIALRCDLDDESALDRRCQVRWERLTENTVVTKVWDNDLNQVQTTLMHVPCYGWFHRLVVGTPYSWLGMKTPYSGYTT